MAGHVSAKLARPGQPDAPGKEKLRRDTVHYPTYSSWLNWIEPEFATLRYFALGGTDHRTHAEQGAAIAAYLRWRNARAQPKRDFAPGSVIRTWASYQNKVA